METLLPWLIIVLGLLSLAAIRFVPPLVARYKYRKVTPEQLQDTGAFLPTSLVITPASMPIVVSLAILICALFIILSHGYADAQQKWAFGAVGTILGYWLKK